MSTPGQQAAAEADQFGSQVRGLEEHKRKDAWENFREKFLGLTEIENILFGEPENTPENQYARNAWERANALPKYSQEREKVMLLMQRTAQKVFDAMSAKIRREGQLTKETRDQLEDLSDGFYRHMVTIGQANKTANLPQRYSPERPDDDVIESSNQVFELNEMVSMRTAMESYSKLDSEEIITMIDEDHGFVSMLIQERNLGELGQDPRAEEDRIDPRDKGDKAKEGRYWHNMEHLREFILSKNGKNGKEKSGARKGAETVLWLEIVRGLYTEQKKDLVGMFLKNGTIPEAQDFMLACVISDVMTAEEVEQIVKHATGDWPKFNENGFDKKLSAALAERDSAKKDMAETVDRMEHMRGGNFANEYLTFNNMILGRIADWGAMTVAVNVILSIGDRLSRRKEGDKDESLAKALICGAGDALANKWVWAGAGAAVASTNLIVPWWKDVALAKNEEEKQNDRKYTAYLYLRERVGNNHERGGYLVETYDDWMKMAERHQRDGEGLVIYPKDVRLTAQKAGELGYQNVKEAQEEMAKLFTVCAVTLGKKNQGELDEYFDQKIFATIRDEHDEKHQDVALAAKSEPKPNPKADEKGNSPSPQEESSST